MLFHSRPLQGPLGGSSPRKRRTSHPKHDTNNTSASNPRSTPLPHGQVPSKSQEKRKLDRWRSLGYRSVTIARSGTLSSHKVGSRDARISYGDPDETGMIGTRPDFG